MIEQKIIKRIVIGDETAYQNHILETLPYFGWQISDMVIERERSLSDEHRIIRWLKISCYRDTNMPNYDQIAKLGEDFDLYDRRYYNYNTQGHEEEMLTHETIDGKPNPLYLKEMAKDKEPTFSVGLGVLLIFCCFPAGLVYLIAGSSRKKAYEKKKERFLKEADEICRQKAEEYFNKAQDALDAAKELMGI